MRDIVRGEPVPQIGGVGEAGKAEERRVQLELGEIVRLAVREILAVGGALDRDHALEDVGAGGAGAMPRMVGCGCV